MSKINKIKLILAIYITVTLTSFGLVVKPLRNTRIEPKPKIVIEEKLLTVTQLVYVPQLTREKVTNKIHSYRYIGGYEGVIQFYNGYVNNLDITYLILSAAEIYNIPVNVLFALAYAESDFKPGAVNSSNKDGTNDRGLLQLNSRYFKGFDRTNPCLNLQHGCQHLRKFYEEYGSWSQAILFYNGYSIEATYHQAKILEKEAKLDRAFSLWVIENAL